MSSLPSLDLGRKDSSAEECSPLDIRTDNESESTEVMSINDGNLPVSKKSVRKSPRKIASKNIPKDKISARENHNNSVEVEGQQEEPDLHVRNNVDSTFAEDECSTNFDAHFPPPRTPTIKKGISKRNTNTKEQIGAITNEQTNLNTPSKTKSEYKEKLLRSPLSPMKCLVCNKTFTKAYLLKRHSLTHSSVKQLTCSICSKSFASKSNVRRHELRHQSLSCNICAEQFNLKSRLNEHVKIVHFSKGHLEFSESRWSEEDKNILTVETCESNETEDFSAASLQSKNVNLPSKPDSSVHYKPKRRRVENSYKSNVMQNEAGNKWDNKQQDQVQVLKNPDQVSSDQSQITQMESQKQNASSIKDLNSFKFNSDKLEKHECPICLKNFAKSKRLLAHFESKHSKY